MDMIGERAPELVHDSGKIETCIDGYDIVIEYEANESGGRLPGIEIELTAVWSNKWNVLSLLDPKDKAILTEEAERHAYGA